jgi:hypothetical protein
MEGLFEKYGKEVMFLTIYTIEAHPQGDPSPFLIDDMANSVWKAYRQQPNSAFLIGYDGRIKLYQEWFEPYQLEQMLLKELRR